MFAGLSWQRVGGVLLFCTIYGVRLSIGDDGDFALSKYLYGVVQALELFVPILLAVIVADRFAPKRMAKRAVVLGLAVTAAGLSGFLLLYLSGNGLAGLMDEPLTWILLWPLQFVAVGWLGLAIYLRNCLDGGDRWPNLDREDGV